MRDRLNRAARRLHITCAPGGGMSPREALEFFVYALRNHALAFGLLIIIVTLAGRS